MNREENDFIERKINEEKKKEVNSGVWNSDYGEYLKK